MDLKSSSGRRMLDCMFFHGNQRTSAVWSRWSMESLWMVSLARALIRPRPFKWPFLEEREQYHGVGEKSINNAASREQDQV